MRLSRSANLFASSAERELSRRFEAFHAANPGAYALFERFAFEVIRAGRTHYSARDIIHRIRWFTNFESVGAEPFKINDHWSPFFGRLFEAKHPEHAGFFERRRSAADTRPTITRSTECSH